MELDGGRGKVDASARTATRRHFERNALSISPMNRIKWIKGSGGWRGARERQGEFTISRKDYERLFGEGERTAIKLLHESQNVVTHFL